MGFKKFRAQQKFFRRDGGLRNYRKRPGNALRKRGGFLCAVNDAGGVIRASEYAFYLRMPAVPYDYEEPALLACMPCYIMYLCNERTGGVYQIYAPCLCRLFEIFLNRFRRLIMQVLP